MTELTLKRVAFSLDQLTSMGSCILRMNSRGPKIVIYMDK